MLISWVLCNTHFNYDPTLFTDWSNTFWDGEVGFLELLKQLTIIWPHDYNLINPPTWYIGLEVRLFVLIPIIVMLCNTRYTNSCLLILFAILFILCGRIFFATCILGCITKIIYLQISQKVIDLSKRKYIITNCILLLLSLFLLNIRNEFNINNNIALILQAIGACYLVLSVSLRNYKLLTNKILLWLGNISFEFYLCHFALLLSFRSSYHDPISYILICLVVSLILSCMINKLCTKIQTIVKIGQ